MKLIIRQILIAVLLIFSIYVSKCENEVDQIKLSQISEKLPTIISDSYRTSNINIDQDCINALFNLPQNGNKILKEPETTIFEVAALLKCWNAEKVFERYFHAIAHIYMKDYLDCMKWHLKQLEPDSILIGNFESSQYEPGYCKNVFDFPYKGILQKHEKTVGPLKLFTCGTVTGMDDFVRFAAKLVLSTYGEYSDEIKMDEMMKLKDYFKDVTFRTVDCILKGLQD